MVKNFLNDENGAIVSIELVLIITIAVLALIVGWSEVAVAVNTELNDISNAVGALAQSYTAAGFVGQDAGAGAKFKSQYGRQFFQDVPDDCDLNGSCDLVGVAVAIAAGG
jgi:Flp pilus assembly pilin Flp